jgi:hypothetical protein
MSNQFNNDLKLNPWALVSWILFFFSLAMFAKSCENDNNSYLAVRKIDSLYQVISKVNTQIDSLKVTRKKLISEEKRIHEESTKIIERILLAPDSSQHLITEELVRDHRQLDSVGYK